jgi:hypothetical protein
MLVRLTGAAEVGRLVTCNTGATGGAAGSGSLASAHCGSGSPYRPTAAELLFLQLEGSGVVVAPRLASQEARPLPVVTVDVPSRGGAVTAAVLRKEGRRPGIRACIALAAANAASTSIEPVADGSGGM